MPMDEKTRKRVLRFLSKGDARPVETGRSELILLDGGARGTISAERKTVAGMVSEGSVQVEAGKLKLACQRSGGDLGSITVDTKAGPQAVTVNWAESPLGQLARRKGRDGKPFLSASEFRAGERLRSDYTRGQIMQRLGANWETSVSSGRREGGIAELTETALAARMRVEKAIRAVGPELSGILIDVCCFLKGMEQVEMERGWPVRSAKVVLKTALGALSRHYNPQEPPRQRHSLHWGAADYRPSIT